MDLCYLWKYICSELFIPALVNCVFHLPGAPFAPATAVPATTGETMHLTQDNAVPCRTQQRRMPRCTISQNIHKFTPCTYVWTHICEQWSVNRCWMCFRSSLWNKENCLCKLSQSQWVKSSVSYQSDLKNSPFIASVHNKKLLFTVCSVTFWVSLETGFLSQLYSSYELHMQKRNVHHTNIAHMNCGLLTWTMCCNSHIYTDINFEVFFVLLSVCRWQFHTT